MRIRNYDGRKNRKIRWQIPSEKHKGEWDYVSVEKVPTAFLITFLRNFERKGYTKIQGIVNEEDEWMTRYILELETEFDKRKDVDEYL